jgi:hypothetical protein
VRTNISRTRESSGNGAGEEQQKHTFQAKFDQMRQLSLIPGGHSDILRRQSFVGGNNL